MFRLQETNYHQNKLQIIMKQTLSYIIVLFIFIFIISCSENSGIKDNLLLPLTDEKQSMESEKGLDNNYTKIVLSLCDEKGENKFTDKNTTYFDLNLNEMLNCFVFSSETDCGYPGGSCGNNIKIYKKTKNKYSIDFYSCGFNITPSIESNNGICSFTYDDKRGYKIKVFWNGEKFEESILTINNLNYNNIQKIAELVKAKEEQFIPDDPDNVDNTSIRVRIESFKFGNGHYCELYTVLLPEKEYFLIESNQIIFNIKDIQSIETIVDNSKKYYDLKIYDFSNYTMTKDTSYLNPILYSYSEENNKYMTNRREQ